MSRSSFYAIATALLALTLGLFLSFDWPALTDPSANPANPSTARPSEGSPPQTPPPAVARTPSALAGTSPGSTATPAQPPAQPGVPDRWAQDQVLQEATTPHPTDPEQVTRVRLLRTDFKYPLVRVEETLQLSPGGAAPTLVSQVAMVADHLVVKLAAGADRAALEQALAALGGTLRAATPAAELYLVTIPDPLSLEGLPQAREALRQARAVIRVAEPDYIVHLLATRTPDDASFTRLWGLHNTGQTVGLTAGTLDADIDAPEAWSRHTGSRTVRVGVIDSGIDYTHPDLAANIWTNPGEIPGNGIDDDRNGYIDDVRGWDFFNNDNDPRDDHGHGTHCAGTIGGHGNNAAGVAGVAWEVSLVGLKIFSASGTTTGSATAEAVAYATRLGLDLTSNSWGGAPYSQVMYEAIAGANAAGQLFVAAAGNDGSNNDTSPRFPCGYALPNIIAVAATNHQDALADFSNFGATTVHLAAPGETIYSTLPNHGYGFRSGTSMATPHVAGAAALLKAYQPALTAPELKSALLQTVDPLSTLAGTTITGGRLNIAKAFDAVEGLLASLPIAWSTTITSGNPLPSFQRDLVLRNYTAQPRTWSLAVNVPWASVAVSSGTLAPRASTSVAVTLRPEAAALAPGSHTGAVTLTESGRDGMQTFPLTLEVLAPVLADFNLATDPGWARTGEWAYGTPLGRGGSVNGNPDPTAGFTGSTVFGVNLAGDYSTAPGGPYTLTAGPFDLSAITQTRLRFQRWLNTPWGYAVSAAVEVSTNNATWQTVWSKPVKAINDTSWSLQDLNLATWADGQPALWVRWSYTVISDHPSGPPKTSSGWNIDDISLHGRLGHTLAFRPLPPIASTTTTASATLRLSSAATLALSVGLQSSDPAALTVPATVTIPAGATSVNVPLTLNPVVPAGERTVVVTAQSPLLPSASLSVTIIDSEAPTLALNAPGQLAEGSVNTATVRLPTASAQPVTVTLTSSDPTRLAAPPTVVIPAGQTAVDVALTAPDDDWIDPPATVLLLATAPGFAPASASIEILDNEPRTLRLALPTEIVEGGPAATGQVLLAGRTRTALSVQITSSDSTALHPIVAVITAGQQTGNVPLLPVNDALTDGTQTVQVTASAPGFSPQAVSLLVRDDDAARVVWSLLASPQTAGKSFNATLTALTVDGTVALAYTGRVAVTAVDDAGEVALREGTFNFYKGVSLLALTVNKASTSLRLRATPTGLPAIESPTIQVQGGAPARLAITDLPGTASTGEPVTVTLTAEDAYGNRATFGGTAALSLTDAVHTVGQGRDLSARPLHTKFHDCRTQVIYPAAELGGAGRLYGLALQVRTAPPIPLQNWTIRIKPTTLTHYETLAWENSGWTVVYQGNVQITTTGWVEFPFTTPFDYNGTDALLIDFSFNNTRWGDQAGGVETTTASTNRVLFGFSDSAHGDPLDWSAGFSLADRSSTVPNLRLRRQAHGGAITPAQTTAFTDGRWTGQVTFTQPSSSLAVRATVDALEAYSGPFSIALAAPRFAAEPRVTGGTGNTLTWTPDSTGSGPFRHEIVAARDTTFASIWAQRDTTTSLAHFGKLAEGFWAYRVRSRVSLPRLGRWSQDFSADFLPNTLVSTSATLAPGNIVLERASTAYATAGTVTTPLVQPANRATWGRLIYAASVPAGTALRLAVLDAAGTVLADDLPSGTDLGGLDAVALQPALRLRASLATTLASVTPVLDEWRVAWTTSEPPVDYVSAWSASVTSIQDATAPSLAVTISPLAADGGYVLTCVSQDANGLSAVTVNDAPATLTPVGSLTPGTTTWVYAGTLPFGRHTLTVTATDTASPANTTTRTVPILRRLPDADADGLPDAWESAHGLDLRSDHQAEGRFGDPDQDGLSNVLEYAFGRDPRRAETTPAYQLSLRRSPLTGEDELVFTYDRLPAPVPLTYTVERSVDLKTWTPWIPSGAQTRVTALPGVLAERVEITGIASSGSLFLRVRVDLD